jgi:hypothetical protein
MKALAVELSKRSRAGAASRITRRPGRCQNGGMRREADKLRFGHQGGTSIGRPAAIHSGKPCSSRRIQTGGTPGWPQ